MTEEQIKAMADEYAAKFEPMFRKVARFAFIEECSWEWKYQRK
jgi:hypothetical protein